jgi:hypothetical protein
MPCDECVHVDALAALCTATQVWGGASHGFGFWMQEGYGEEEGEEFLSLTQQLATSSAYGAVQASYGPCLGLQQLGGSGPSSAGGPLARQPSSIFLIRFEEQEQMIKFMQCPPVAAMLEGDVRSPLAALWHAVLEVAPPERSSTKPQRGGQPLS